MNNLLIVDALLLKHKKLLADRVKAGESRERNLTRLLGSLIPKALALVTSPSKNKTNLCPRQVGKTWTSSVYMLYQGEKKDGAVTVGISLTKDQVRRNLWEGPSGILATAKREGVEIETNDVRMSWRHKNGSVGYLLGAEDARTSERLRGMTPDLVIVDEAQSFGRTQFQNLIMKIVMPQLAPRKGSIVLQGTPGPVLAGDFYFLTSPGVIDERAGRKESSSYYHGEEAKGRMWECFGWGIKDSPLSHMLDNAMAIKKSNGWGDDHPTWVSEYMGRWCSNPDALVSAYGSIDKDMSFEYSPKQMREWNTIYSVYYGFESRVGITIAKWSKDDRKLYYVYSKRLPPLSPEDLSRHIADMSEVHGKPTHVVVDTGRQGKRAIEIFREQYLLPAEEAEVSSKVPFVSLHNSEMHEGRVRFHDCQDLIDEMESLTWDLRGGSRESLASRGSLVENREAPRECYLSAIYILKHAHHYVSAPAVTATKGPAWGSKEWVEQKCMERFKRKFRETFHDPVDRPERSIFEDLGDGLYEGFGPNRN